MSNRAINFFAGPSKLPDEVMHQAAKEMLDYDGLGYGVMEMSHRSPTFTKICSDAEQSLRDIMCIPDNYKVLFLQGGCTGMFAAVALNLLPVDGTADYVVTGVWSDKSAIEAEKYGKVNRVLPKREKYLDIPDQSEWNVNKDASYLYFCSNETVNGVEFDYIPEANGVPLVCDMSSNIMTKEIDITKFACVVAGAQKLLGPAGVTMVIVRDDMIGKERKECPTIWNFQKQATASSCVNTPPCYSIYITGLVFNWIKKQGGVQEFEKQNKDKSSLLYKTMESSKGFYRPVVNPSARSRINVPFTICGGNENVEKKFVAEAKKQGMVGLGGHRSVGGCRASLYNAATLNDVKTLVKFMEEFQLTNQN